MIAGTKQATVENTITMGQEYQASVREEDMPWVISLFTDLYKNRVLAVIREYATNAFDAHVAAGINRPIEVTLPSYLAQSFVIRDYGIGLTADEIGTIYSKYGRSTKRGSNDAVGMLGMGCKSALTYSPQFTVSSVKDGLRTDVLVTRQENGVPTFRAMPSVATTEPTGTTVTVPVERQDVQRFEREARKFYSFWQPGTILLNGEDPSKEDGLKVTDNIRVVDAEGYDSPDYIVMGNVAYPHNLPHGLPYGKKIVARVPIGSCMFVPSRESLQESPETRQTLKQVITDLKSGLAKAIENRIASAQTPREALQALMDNRELLDEEAVSKVTWKGRQVPLNLKLEPYAGKTDAKGDTVGAVDSVYVTYINRTPMNNTSRRSGIDWGEVPQSVILHGFELSGFTANHKRKLKKLLEDRGLTGYSAAFLCGPKPSSDWLTDEQIIAWEDVQAVKLPRVVTNPRTGASRVSGSYDVWINGSQHSQKLAAEFDTSKPIFYFHGPVWNAHTDAQVLAEFYPKGYTLVTMPGNRIEKFKRDFPNATTAQVAVTALWDKWQASITDEQKLALHLHSAYEAQSIKAVVKAFQKVGMTPSDPAIVAAQKALAVPVKTLIAQRDRFGRYAKKMPATFDNPLDKYPLIPYHYHIVDRATDVALYINAMYEHSVKTTTPNR